MKLFRFSETISEHKRFSTEIDENYESTLDGLLVSHEKNFRLRNISMLEYMDFLDTYIGNKMIILDTKKNLINTMKTCSML